MPVSAPEAVSIAARPGVALGRFAADIVEVGAYRGRAQELAAVARAQGVTLPQFGRMSAQPSCLSLCVRPQRWLLLTPPAAPGAAAAGWQRHCAAAGAAVDLSSGLAAAYLDGPAMRDALARGCRLDLDPEVFAAGHAAATIVAQVSIILAALGPGLLLLTPATTAAHLIDWLESAARALGPLSHTNPSLADLIGRTQQ
jgi:heterotetrameric sarcosine oxidase gamma subunit